MKKPRIRFCWHCGRKLYGNHHEEKEVQGHLRILHKVCWKDIENNGPDYEDGPWAEGWEERSND